MAASFPPPLLPPPRGSSFADTVALMYSCLRYASAMWKKLGGAPQETIQATAACIFIESNRKGIRPTEKQVEIFKNDLMEKEK